MTDDEKCKVVSEKMKELGLTLGPFLDYQLSSDRSFLSMPQEKKVEFGKCVDDLQKKYKTTKAKGDVLESLASCLMFSEYDIFQLMKNVKTSSNEIDLLVSLSDKGTMVVPKLYSFLGERFLCECKNYGRKLSVTYVGKFYSLMKTVNVNVGILFTVNGVTGKHSWDASCAFIRKVALKEGVAILVFEYKDYILIKDKNAIFLDLVKNKYQSLMDDINYEKYISPHEASSGFSS